MNRCTMRWIDALELAEESAEADWKQAEQRLEAVFREWQAQNDLFHMLLEHEDLDEAEVLFAGVFSACRERETIEYRMLLRQLITQLRLIADTQRASLQNVL